MDKSASINLYVKPSQLLIVLLCISVEPLKAEDTKLRCTDILMQTLCLKIIFLFKRKGNVFIQTRHIPCVYGFKIFPQPLRPTGTGILELSINEGCTAVEWRYIELKSPGILKISSASCKFAKIRYRFFVNSLRSFAKFENMSPHGDEPLSQTHFSILHGMITPFASNTFTVTSSPCPLVKRGRGESSTIFPEK